MVREWSARDVREWSGPSRRMGAARAARSNGLRALCTVARVRTHTLYELCTDFVVHFAGDVGELEFVVRGVSEARDERSQCMLHGYERKSRGTLIENERPGARRTSILYRFVRKIRTRGILSTA